MRALRDLAQNWPLLLKTLVIGTCGGYLFSLIQSPLPWMMGSLFACTVAALAGVRLYMPNDVRRVWMVVLGVMLGAAFAPDVLDRLATWGGVFAGMMAFTVLGAAAGAWFFHRVGRLDRRTAFFCAAPGGLGEMSLLGPAFRADERAILLAHSTRILMVMFIVPPAYRLLADYVPPADLGGSRLADLSLHDWVVLTASAIVGGGAAKLLRVPAWQMVGPMLVSAAAHIGGLTDSRPPTELLAAAQVFIGCGAGARFVGVRPRELGRTVAAAAMYYAAFLAAAFLVAGAVAALGGFDFKAVHLAYTPGGFAEMNLIALSLDIDVAFVATHHTGRLFAVVIGAALLARMLWSAGRRGDYTNGR